MKVITDSKTVKKYVRNNPDLTIVEQMELEWPAGVSCTGATVPLTGMSDGGTALNRATSNVPAPPCRHHSARGRLDRRLGPAEAGAGRDSGAMRRRWRPPGHPSRSRTPSRSRVRQSGAAAPWSPARCSSPTLTSQGL